MFGDVRNCRAIVRCNSMRLYYDFNELSTLLRTTFTLYRVAHPISTSRSSSSYLLISIFSRTGELEIIRTTVSNNGAAIFLERRVNIVNVPWYNRRLFFRTGSEFLDRVTLGEDAFGVPAEAAVSGDRSAPETEFSGHRSCNRELHFTHPCRKHDREASTLAKGERTRANQSLR